jgi:hypothetical protein
MALLSEAFAHFVSSTYETPQPFDKCASCGIMRKYHPIWCTKYPETITGPRFPVVNHLFVEKCNDMVPTPY